jgi:2-polyprenyl-3-methyl-5-hydroxy-6-metoxy-1,4-benzoquinol methylase
MFDARFALTESLRFHFDLQEGKKRILAGLLPGLKDKDVLDFGCGCGYYTRWFARVARHVTGVDISPHSLAFARSVNPGPRYSEEVPDESYDVIVCADSLEFNDDSLALISMLLPRLRSDGVMYISAPDFSARPLPVVVRIAWGVYERLRWPYRRQATRVIREIERGADYHARYRRDFNTVLERYLVESGTSWERRSYAMTGWQKNHYLYAIRPRRP